MGARMEKGARTAKGRAQIGSRTAGGDMHGQGAHTRVPLMVAVVPRHVGGVRAYARAHHWGANGGRARFQGGAYICFALLI
jgi:hypothetical protein